MRKYKVQITLVVNYDKLDNLGARIDNEIAQGRLTPTLFPFWQCDKCGQNNNVEEGYCIRCASAIDPLSTGE